VANLSGNRPQADNEQDNLDTSQSKFDEIVGRLKDVEERGEQIYHDPSTLFDDDTQEDDGVADEDTVGEQEGNPRDSWYSESPVNQRASTFGGWLKGWSKNFGPSAGIFGAITGGGSIMFSLFLIPAGLSTALDRIMTNDASDSTRMNILTNRAFLSAIIGKADCSTKIKCRFTTMDKEQVDKWKAAGFTVEPNTPDKDGRYRVTSMQFPDDGPKFTNSKDFFAYVDGNVSARQHVDNVVNARSSPYNAKYAKYKKILAKYGLSKGKVFTSSTDPDKEKRTKAMDESIDEHTKAIPVESGTADPKKIKEDRTNEYKTKLDNLQIFDEKVSSRINSIGGKTYDKTMGAAGAIGAACTAYSTVKATNAGIKLLMWKDIIAFAFPFFQTFAQTIDEGNVEPERLEYVMDRLTWYYTDQAKDLYQEIYGPYSTKDNPENPSVWEREKGLTAMDSRGIQAMINGNLQALKTFSENYMGWKAVASMGTSTVLNVMESTFGGAENLKDVCFGAKVINTAGIVGCAAGPHAVALCIGAFALNAIFAEDIKNAVVATMIVPALEVIAHANLTSSLKGARLGDALAAGISLWMADQARGSGTVAATTQAAIKKFVMQTDDIYQKQTVELAQYEARNEPFNTANQYSFISQLASSLNVGRSYFEQQTVYSNLANMFAVVASPLQYLSGSNASALMYQPSQLGIYAQERTADTQCRDTDLKAIKVLCDGVSGKTVGVAPDGVVEALMGQVDGSRDIVTETVDYMRSHNFIDDEGKALGDNNPSGPIGDDEGESVNPENKEEKAKYEYIKWKNYCTEDRIDPVGMSTKPIDSTSSTEDMEWWIYARCVGKDYKGDDKNDSTLTKNLFYFSIYYNLCETQASIASDKLDCTDRTAAPTTTATPASTTPSSGTIALDPGHNVQEIHDIEPTTGAQLYDYPNGKEVDDMWDVATRVKVKLEQEGYSVKMLRSSKDERVNFQQRADRAKGSVVAISLHSTPSGGSQVGAQVVGGYRKGDGGGVLTFSNTVTAGKSSEYAAAMAKGRNEKEGGGVTVRGFNFDTRGGGIAIGNIPWVQLLSQDTPWIYNEMQPSDGGGGANGISEAAKNKYVEGIVAGVKAMNIQKSAGS